MRAGHVGVFIEADMMRVGWIRVGAGGLDVMRRGEGGQFFWEGKDESCSYILFYVV
jgi:hypothetical protein